MSISAELIKEFVKITNDKSTKDDGSKIYGTVMSGATDGYVYVKLDGSNISTPVVTTCDTKIGDRVSVTIMNHTATIEGNVSSPAARVGDLIELSGKVDEHGNAIAMYDNKIVQIDNEINQVSNTIDQQNNVITQIGNVINQHNATITQYGTSIEQYGTDIAQIYTSIEQQNVNISQQNTAIEQMNTSVSQQNTKIAQQDTAISQQNTTINQLGDTIESQGNVITQHNSAIETINSAVSTHDSAITANQSSIGVLNSAFVIKDGNVTGLNSIVVNDLVTNNLEAKYANIDFANIGIAAVEKLFAESGIISDLVVDNQHITGELVGVTIKGDLIEGNTVVADKLVVKGEDGLYYKLNTDGMTTEAEQTDYNSLNGSIITVKSITATKIDVEDLVAFQATIGGFNIDQHSIYSGAKNSAANTSRGVYLGDNGEIAAGDATEYLRYIKQSDGTYILEISANSISYGTDHKSVDTAIDDAISDIEIGGRNLIVSRDLFENGRIVDSTDEPMTFDDLYVYTNHIDVSPNERYTISFFGSRDSSDSSVDIGCFDDDDVYLGRIFHNDSTLPFYDVLQMPASAAYCIISYGTSYTDEIKFEKGNKSTDWSPSPEDMATLANVSSSVSVTKNEILNTVSSTYYTKDDGNEAVKAYESRFKQLDDALDLEFSAISTKIGQVSDSIPTKLFKHFVFDDTGLSILGNSTGEEDATLCLDNSGISFNQGGENLGLWDKNHFYTGGLFIDVQRDDGPIGTHMARFGNYAFIPRSDGSLQLLKVGGE